ncbi:MAG: RNA-guided pseudouridylation complex pseudouridine synthase subunit Cbf5 [Candidatus Lokiarchaeota archaeon]|nr:RNA-guided pseudouridylation complex pseudouridine synthase subunit Cbf5 [Candidatus Lokiarchaeota archaeon]
MGILPADRPRDIIVKATDSTNPAYGFESPKDIPIEHLLDKGVVSLDKPAGPSSHEIATWARKILGSDKAGHGGTLDPAVTGVLPLGIGDGTKAMQALLSAGKEYITILELHASTPEAEIKRVIEEFTGKIYQKPPLRSSVKRVLRVREIYYNEVLEIKGRLVLMKVGCQAGTYIRKLCHDLGDALGTGGHMKELRRTRVGPFKEEKRTCSLYDLKDAYCFWKDDGYEKELREYLLPVEYALQHLPYLELRDSAVDAICHGADLAANGIVRLTTGIKEGDMVLLRTMKGEAVALSRSQGSSNEIAKKNTGIVAVTERVLMERGRYPSMWKRD